MDIINTALSYIYGNGWVGVGIGITLFLIGYVKGLSKAKEIVPTVIDITLENLIRDGFVKTRKVINDNGEWEEELLKYDEKV